MKNRVTKVAFLMFCLIAPFSLFAQSPKAELPTWTAGSYWRYQGKANGTVMHLLKRVEGTKEIDGQKYYVLRSGSQKQYFNLELNPTIIENSRGEVINSVSPNLAYFNWPLEVGKTWSQKVTHVIDGKTYNYTQDFKVLAYEKVSTPAGEFNAFKLSRATLSGGTYEEYWYAPEVRNIVKMNSVSGTGGEKEYSLAAYEFK